MEDLQLLTTVNSEFEAELIKYKLAEAHIECFIQAGDSENMLPAVDLAEGVRIFVEPYDLEKASWLIRQNGEELTDDMEVGGSE
jgi:hypothetical protein